MRHPAGLLPVTQEGMAILAILWEQQGRPTDGWIFPVRKVTAVGTGYTQWDVGPIRTDPTRSDTRTRAIGTEENIIPPSLQPDCRMV